MVLAEVSQKAEELAKRFNPEGLAPFPYDHITAAYTNLDIVFSEELDTEISGATLYKNEVFTILINAAKPAVRQHFTIAHELGHFFLHQNSIKAQQAIIDEEGRVDQAALYRRDDETGDQLEIEANNFAASLLMPEWLVHEVWGVSKGIEDAAQLFHVSVVAMSIRLTRMGLLE